MLPRTPMTADLLALIRPEYRQAFAVGTADRALNSSPRT
jgi:hypothetical protein